MVVMNIDGTVCLLQTGIMAGPVVEISVLRTIRHEIGEYAPLCAMSFAVCTVYPYGGIVENLVPRII